MAFEKLKNEQPDKYYNLQEIRAECKKLNPGEVLDSLFWLVNSQGHPVTRKEDFKRSRRGERIVFGFQNKIKYDDSGKAYEQQTGLEITGRRKVEDPTEHPMSEMKQVLREYEAVGFMKVEKEQPERPEPRAPLLGENLEVLKENTEQMYRAQIEEIIERSEPDEENSLVSDSLFARAISRMSSKPEDSPDLKETVISMKDERGRNISIEIKFLGNMMVPRENDTDPIQLQPGLMIRMSLPERQGDRALDPHAMPEHQARIFAGLVHIMRNPETYTSTKQEFDRLGVRLIELQTREWLEPPSKEQHQNLRIVYERRRIE